MGNHYLLSVFFASTLAAGCATGPVSNNASHSGMDHGNTNQNSVAVQPMDHSNMNHGSGDHSTMKSSPDATTAEYDLQFIDTMIAHHQGAVDMAKLIPAKASSPDLKKMGSEIVSSQEKEISAMQSWRQLWFGGKPEAVNMEMSGMKDSMAGMDMKKLDALSGKPFDLEFVRQMIPHHEGAVVMAKEALQKSKRDEIKTLANSIIRAQNAEIDMMRAWKTAWNK